MNSKEGCNTQPSTIAVIGFSARAAAQCARRQGYGVVAVDGCADRDLLADCQMHLRLEDPDWPTVLNQRFPSAPLLLTGGMEHRGKLVDRCHLNGRRCGATGDQIGAMRSLANWEEWARESEIAWPTTISDLRNAHPLIHRLSKSKWLLKSRQSAGGAGTIVLTDTSSLIESNDRDQANLYIQERLPGVSIGVTFLNSQFGCTVIGAAMAWPSESQSHAKEFIYRGSIGPIALPIKMVNRLQRFADVVSIRTGLLGLWQADFLLNEGALTLLEINPRWSGSMDLLDVARDLALTRMHIDAIGSSLCKSTFDQFSKRCSELLGQPNQTHRDRMLGKLIVYADQPLRVTQAQSDHWWAHRWNHIEQSDEDRCCFADIPQANTDVAQGDPILTVLTTGKSEQGILRALQRAKSLAIAT